MERNASYYLNLNISFKCASVNLFLCLLHVTKSAVYPDPLISLLRCPVLASLSKVSVSRVPEKGQSWRKWSCWQQRRFLHLSIPWEKSAPNYAQHGSEQSCVQDSLVMPTRQEAPLSSSLQESLLPLSMTLPLPHKLTKSWNYLIAKRLKLFIHDSQAGVFKSMLTIFL